jgi:ATP-dependent helicase HrpB
LDLSDERLFGELDNWLPEALGDATSLQEINPDSVHNSVTALLPWDWFQRVDKVAPATWTAPTGTQKPIEYPDDGPPQVTIRVQELFGLKTHPMLGNPPFPLRFCLTSPAHRPIQITQDLPAFWQGSWRDVRIEMKARYPRHEWPQDPANALPTTRAKPRTP